MADKNKNTEKLKYINGPVNTFRMEGHIDGKKKVIYLFGDYHMEPNEQTQCSDIRAIEIKDYLLQNFMELEKNNKNVDFFLEIKPYFINEKNHHYRDNYIFSLMYFFKKCFNFDVKKNKIYTSTQLPNVRFHYMDIRNLISFNYMNIRNLISFDYKNLFKDFYVFYTEPLYKYYLSNDFYLSIESINIIIELMKKIHDNYIFIFDSLFKKNELTKTYNEKMYSEDYIFDENIAKNIIKKMYNCADKNIQNILNNIKKKYIKPKILKVILLTTKITNILNEYIQFSNNYIETEKYINKFTKLKLNLYYNFYILSEKTSMLGCILTDMYFIRRFLDKKYIERSVIYGGMHHTMDYIFMLIKYFNFKITHFSYSNGDIDEITKIIKNSKNNFNISELCNLFIPYSVLTYQCSNVTTFPDNFS